MKSVNLENNRIALVVPLELKKHLYEMASRKGMNLSSFVIGELWRLVDEQRNDTGCTA